MLAIWASVASLPVAVSHAVSALWWRLQVESDMFHVEVNSSSLLETLIRLFQNKDAGHFSFGNSLL